MAVTHPPRSAKASIERIEALFSKLKCGRLASLIGRYYAMDRDNRWNRVEKAYNVMTLAEGDFNFDNGVEALNAAYERDENDEFVAATTITPTGATPASINDGDTVIFANFRADRAREITRAFVEPEFDGFTKKKNTRA